MEKVSLLDNIGQDSIDMMIPCFKPITRKYRKDDTILSYSAGVPASVAVLFRGQARLEILNEEGDLFLLERYEGGDVFGELFSLPLENFEYIVKALTDCTVVYLDYNHIITPCENLCAHHSQLISNLFMMTAQKAQELSLHISILGQNSTRDKLMTYLKHVRSQTGRRLAGSGISVDRASAVRSGEGGTKKTPNTLSSPPDRLFTLPMTLGQLAEYLMVDRSSMMRELRAMKDDGLIESKNRQFRILV